jgi:hypothetical protein
MGKAGVLGLLLALGFIFGGFAFAQEQETMILTTYYPAPYGVYKNLAVQDGQLTVDSDVEPQVDISSENANAGIHIKAPEGYKPYIDLESGGGTVRMEGDDDVLRVSGPIRPTAIGTEGYFRIYHNDEVLP